MVATARVYLKWNPQAIDQAKIAGDTILLETARTVAGSAKMHVHRITGTLSRSIHVDLPGADHTGEQAQAAAGRDFTPVSGQLETLARIGSLGRVEIGSWVNYAVYEERRHPYLYPAMERGRSGFAAAVAIAARSWRSQGW